MKKGMKMYVYRAPAFPGEHKATASDRLDVVTVTGPGVPEIVEPSDDAPEYHVGETLPGYTVLYPATDPAGRPMKPDTKEFAGPMFSGNYAAGSDSRIRGFAGVRPIPIHDRFETWPEYAALSI